MIKILLISIVMTLTYNIQASAPSDEAQTLTGGGTGGGSRN